MKGLSLFKQAAVGLACWGFLVPQSHLMAAAPQAAQSPAAPIVHDVALGAGGTLTGYVVDSQGLGTEGAVVSLRANDRELAHVVTDANGRYIVQNVRGGVYQVVVGQSSQFVRVWAPNTAPPAARESALLVSGDGAVRSQGLGGNGLTAATFGIATASLIVSIITLAEVNDSNDTIINLQGDVDNLEYDLSEVLTAVSP